MIRLTAIVLGLSALSAGACSHKVQPIDPDRPETIDTKFGFPDLKLVANDMTQSFLGSDKWGGDRPRIVFGGVRNRTQQHLDTENITDTIRTALIQSGKFSVLAGAVGIAEIEQETTYQQSGPVDMASAVELGKQLGAEYVLYGALREMRKERDDLKVVWYKFTMNAVNVQTRQLVWAEEQDIAKMEEKTLFGW